MDDFLMGDDAAERLGVSRARLYQLAKGGRLGRNVRGHWVFTQAELDAYKASEKDKGGRPKSETVMTSPVMAG